MLFSAVAGLQLQALLAAGVLGDCLGSLRHSVLGKLSWQEKTHSSLDFSAGDGGPPVVVSQTGSLSSNPLEDVIDKGVHDAHGLGRNSGVRVHLLQHLVDVDAVGFPPPPLPLLVPRTGSLGLGSGLLRSFAGYFGWHSFLFKALNRNDARCKVLDAFI